MLGECEARIVERATAELLDRHRHAHGPERTALDAGDLEQVRDEAGEPRRPRCSTSASIASRSAASSSASRSAAAIVRIAVERGAQVVRDRVQQRAAEAIGLLERAPAHRLLLHVRTGGGERDDTCEAVEQAVGVGPELVLGPGVDAQISVGRVARRDRDEREALLAPRSTTGSRMSVAARARAPRSRPRSRARPARRARSRPRGGRPSSSASTRSCSALRSGGSSLLRRIISTAASRAATRRGLSGSRALARRAGARSAPRRASEMQTYTSSAAMLASLSMRNDWYGSVKKKLKASAARDGRAGPEPRSTARGNDRRDQQDQRHRARIEGVPQRQQAQHDERDQREGACRTGELARTRSSPTRVRSGMVRDRL